MEKNFINPAPNVFTQTSFKVCGCCLELDDNTKYARVFVYGMKAWAGCVIASLILSSAMLMIETVSVPVVCTRDNTTYADPANST